MKYQFYFAMINYEYNTAILIYMYKYIYRSMYTIFLVYWDSLEIRIASTRANMVKNESDSFLNG
jgi:hypothetical protein